LRVEHGSHVAEEPDSERLIFGERREATRIYVKMLENPLAAITPDEPSFVEPAAAHEDIRARGK
jgi:hypothetical protein